MSLIPPLELQEPASLNADLLVLGTFSDRPPPLAGFDGALVSAAEQAAQRPGFAARRNQIVEASPSEGVAVQLRGLGKAGDLNRFGLAEWLEKTLTHALDAGCRSVAVRLPDHPETTGEEAALRIERQLLVAAYRFVTFKRSKSKSSRLESLKVVAPPGDHSSWQSAAEQSEATAQAVAFGREVGNTPGNVANPAWMEERAREIAAENGLEIEVLQQEELREKGMGGILAVGGGASVAPRLVRMSYGDRGPRVALVGKGVTFDSGGISIKPSASMEEMKYDKCGSVNVLAAAGLIARLKLPVRLSVYLPFAENMPDAAAYRPGDIVRCYNGKTVEIHNTDAEGRMILADALSLAVEEGCDWLVELSTLTGATVVALGLTGAAVYSPSDDLAEGLVQAAEASGERLWRMPLWEEFVRSMKGTHADLKNVSGRWGSANSAAAFLGEFVGDHQQWAHMDIAGPAAIGKDGKGVQGATGYGISLLISWLESLTEE